MSSYCLKCGENTNNTILQVSRSINGGIITLSKCAVCGDKKSKFIKKQEAKGLLTLICIKWVPGDPSTIFWQPVLLKKCQKAQIPCVPPF